MNNAGQPKISPFGLDHYAPPLSDNLRYPLKLLIDGIYDNLHEQETPEYQLIGERLTKVVAECCALYEELDEARASSGYRFESEVLRQFSKGNHLAAIAAFNREAAIRRELEGPHAQARESQKRKLKRLSEAEWVEIRRAGRWENLGKDLKEYLADVGIDPTVIFPDLRAEGRETASPSRGEGGAVENASQES